MSQIFVESGELKKHGNDLMKKLAEFINGIAALKVDAKVDGDDVALTPKPFTQKTGKKVGGKRRKEKAKYLLQLRLRPFQKPSLRCT